MSFSGARAHFNGGCPVCGAAVNMKPYNAAHNPLVVNAAEWRGACTRGHNIQLFASGGPSVEVEPEPPRISLIKKRKLVGAAG